MNSRITSDGGRIVGRIGRSIRQASIAAAPTERTTSSAEKPIQKRRSRREQHGENIFVYSHLQTKQVVYSLTPAVKNNHALRQLPYNGKKSVPAALRKDLWYPMATIQFDPTVANAPQLGLSTFQKLREYRRLHETQWAIEDMAGLSKKERGRKLKDQRANSVADMAAALTRVLETDMPANHEAKISSEENTKSNNEAAPALLATVKWADLLDAEYAESWPRAVVHDSWEIQRNNRTPRSVSRLTQSPAKTAAAHVQPPADLPKDESGKIVL